MDGDHQVFNRKAFVAMAKHWYVKLKEVGHGVLTTEYVGDKSREDVIKWFGLDQPDVEWYKLRCEEE